MRLDDRHIALKVAGLNLLINTVLAVLKLSVGIGVGSDAVVSDGFHSCADAVSTIVVMIGIHVAAKRSDACHPYGYERLECVAAVLLSILIGVTGVGIGVGGVRSIVDGVSTTTSVGVQAVWLSVAAIGVKESMFHITKHIARQTGSSALAADAWHQRVDALSSVGSLVGVVGMRNGLAILDPIASVVISFMIMKAAVTIFVDAMRKMIDRSCDAALSESIAQTVLRCEAVLSVEELKTRLFGSRVYAEITVAINGDMSAREAYRIVDTVQIAVTESFSVVKACSVHLHPI